MPLEPRPPSDRRPPVGVPRWLWPPPGASVTAVVLEEVREPGRPPRYRVPEGERPAHGHFRALWWLLDEYDRAPEPQGAYEGRIRLEIARTEMPHGRVGHAYAVNGGPLGDPGADSARGILWRWCEYALADA